MTQIPGLGAAGPAAAERRGSRDLRELEVDQFLGLLIAEMQNQDPLNPMDNSELLQQISQIREISATNQLSETLASVVQGQHLSTASSLIGKRITALADDQKDVEGVVDRVSLAPDPKDDKKQVLKIHIGDKTISMQNIRDIKE